MEPSLTWEMDTRDGVIYVKLQGNVTESSNFAELAPQLTGDVCLDLAGVRRVNSAGVREWIDFVSGLKSRLTKLSFIRCSVAIVHQLNMIEGFGGGAEIKSAYAPYFCTKCNSEHADLLELSGPVTIQDTLPCPKCGGSMEFDELPQYLSFHQT